MTSAGLGTGAPPPAPSRASRYVRRLRRGAALLAHHRRIAQFAGGYLAVLTIVLALWRARGLGAILGWARSAALHGQHLNPRRYAAWASRQHPIAGCGTLLVVASTMGMAAAQVSPFLGQLLRAGSRLADATLLLVTDHAGAKALSALAGARNTPAPMIIETAPRLCAAAVVAAALRRVAEFDCLALLKPGYLPAALRSPAAKAPLELFYGDEDSIDAAGARSRPFFKPGFSPDLLLVRDYFGCLLAPRELALTLPPDVEDFHSAALRLVERARRVTRLNAVLAHRFQPAAPETSAPPAHLRQFLRRRYGPAATVRTGASGPARWRCHFGHADASVSVIVPTRDRLALLRNCVEGVFASNQGDFEVIVLDNGSTAPETHRWFAEAAGRWPRFRVLPAPGPFNWSRLNNLGVAHARGEVFVFLNNDTEPRGEHWLARLADVALREDVGAVGALLLYADGRIQHAGVVVGDEHWTDHIYRGEYPTGGEHVFVHPALPRNVTAVTGACMAMARRTIDAIGGFDERLAVAGNDVEICVRALRHGYYNVYLPDVVLTHFESQSRGRRDPAADVQRLLADLRANLPVDPFFNPNLASGPVYLSRPKRGRVEDWD